VAIEVVTVEHFGTFLTATAVLATIVAQLGSVGAPKKDSAQPQRAVSWDMQIIFPGCCYIKYSENG
jgi:hypothetical protein